MSFHARAASLRESAMNDHVRFCCDSKNSEWRDFVADSYRDSSNGRNYGAERAYALLIASSKKNLVNRIYCFGASLPSITSPPAIALGDQLWLLRRETLEPVL
ncbi:MAG: hypothetical protein DMG96_02235 [Acidobacteria bacterium]|nr:MAG: hypothetical protein DMG96_02235 [Acidobacteriota bacterium]